MSTNSTMLQVGSIEALVVRKPIKNLHLSVLPPLGKVRVSAPLYMKDDVIRTLLATRLGWINKQKAKFEGQERQTPRQYVSGESHYFLGRRYRFEVFYEDKPAQVELTGKNKILLHVRPKSALAKREEVVMEWNLAHELVAKWQKTIRTKGLGNKANENPMGHLQSKSRTDLAQFRISKETDCMH
jgi:predicted metal-dependent hydrolase